MGFGVGDECVAAVVRYVEPFVAVGGPRVGEADILYEVTMRRAGGEPEAEGAIDVYPGLVVMGEWNQL